MNDDALPFRAFQNFDHLNATILSGNPLTSVSPGAFEDVSVRYLEMANCFLATLEPRALAGMHDQYQKVVNAFKIKT